MPINTGVESVDEPSAEKAWEDKGAIAAERMRQRMRHAAHVAKRVMFYTVLSLSIIAILAIVLLGYTVYSKRVTGYTSNYQNCSVDVGSSKVTGIRTFSYHYTDYAAFFGFQGFRYIDKAGVTEKTVINVANTSITIGGLTDQKWWSFNIVPSDKGTTPNLKPADYYVFVVPNGKGVNEFGGIAYDSFCK